MQAARDADGAAHGEIEFGELLASDVGGRVDACTTLADGNGENVIELALAQEVAHELIGLASGGSVADGNGAHVVLRHQTTP